MKAKEILENLKLKDGMYQLSSSDLETIKKELGIDETTIKRYIRTKDGKIIDLEKECSEFDANTNDLFVSLNCICCKKDNGTIGLVEVNDIYKMADTIDELIEVGDLVRSFGALGEVVKVGDVRIETHSHYVEYDCVIELYTKRDNNYILVAKKENEKWKVI